MMKMIQKALSLLCLNALLLIAAAGCHGNGGPLPEPSPEEGTVPLTFAATVPETRAGAATTANLSSMGIFAYYTGNNDWTTSDKPNFMYNQEVKRDPSAPWTYSPVKYWPNTLNDKLTFFAYAPYVKEAEGSNLSFQPVTNGGYPYLRYTMPAKDGNQADLLVSIPPLMNQTYGTNNGKVSFTMDHALTRVSVYVKSGDNVQGKQITAFSIKAMQQGLLAFLAPTPPYDKHISWTYVNPIAMQAVSPSASLPYAVPAVKDEKKLFADFFLLPAKGINGADHRFSITYTTAGTVESGQAPVQTVALNNQPLPLVDDWDIGSYVSYTFLIEKQKLTVKSSTHPTWNDAGTGTITGSVVITYTENATDPNWGNGGSGSVDGKPVVTHTTVQNDVQWEDGGTEIVIP